MCADRRVVSTISVGASHKHTPKNAEPLTPQSGQDVASEVSNDKRKRADSANSQNDGVGKAKRRRLEINVSPHDVANLFTEKAIEPLNLILDDYADDIEALQKHKDQCVRTHQSRNRELDGLQERLKKAKSLASSWKDSVQMSMLSNNTQTERLQTELASKASKLLMEKQFAVTNGNVTKLSSKLNGVDVVTQKHASQLQKAVTRDEVQKLIFDKHNQTETAARQESKGVAEGLQKSITTLENRFGSVETCVNTEVPTLTTGLKAVQHRVTALEEIAKTSADSTAVCPSSSDLNQIVDWFQRGGSSVESHDEGLQKHDNSIREQRSINKSVQTRLQALEQHVDRLKDEHGREKAKLISQLDESIRSNKTLHDEVLELKAAVQDAQAALRLSKNQQKSANDRLDAVERIKNIDRQEFDDLKDQVDKRFETSSTVQAELGRQIDDGLESQVLLKKHVDKLATTAESTKQAAEKTTSTLEHLRQYVDQTRTSLEAANSTIKTIDGNLEACENKTNDTLSRMDQRLMKLEPTERTVALATDTSLQNADSAGQEAPRDFDEPPEPATISQITMNAMQMKVDRISYQLGRLRHEVDTLKTTYEDTTVENRNLRRHVGTIVELTNTVTKISNTQTTIINTQSTLVTSGQLDDHKKVMLEHLQNLQKSYQCRINELYNHQQVLLCACNSLNVLVTQTPGYALNQPSQNLQHDRVLGIHTPPISPYAQQRQPGHNVLPNRQRMVPTSMPQANTPTQASRQYVDLTAMPHAGTPTQTQRQSPQQHMASIAMPQANTPTQPSRQQMGGTTIPNNGLSSETQRRASHPHAQNMRITHNLGHGVNLS